MTEVKIISRVFFPVDSESGLNFAVACILTEKINVFTEFLGAKSAKNVKFSENILRAKIQAQSAKFFSCRT